MLCENCVNAALGAGFSKHLAVGAAEPVNVDALARSSARDTLLVSSRDSAATQRCGPGMVTPEPGSQFFHPGSRVRKIPDPHQRIQVFFKTKKIVF
jgi:hypothetical protein